MRPFKNIAPKNNVPKLQHWEATRITCQEITGTKTTSKNNQWHKTTSGAKWQPVAPLNIHYRNSGMQPHCWLTKYIICEWNKSSHLQLHYKLTKKPNKQTNNNPTAGLMKGHCTGQRCTDHNGKHLALVLNFCVSLAASHIMSNCRTTAKRYNCKPGTGPAQHMLILIKVRNSTLAQENSKRKGSAKPWNSKTHQDATLHKISTTHPVQNHKLSP